MTSVLWEFSPLCKDGCCSRCVLLLAGLACLLDSSDAFVFVPAGSQRNATTPKPESACHLHNKKIRPRVRSPMISCGIPRAPEMCKQPLAMRLDYAVPLDPSQGFTSPEREGGRWRERGLVDR